MQASPDRPRELGQPPLDRHVDVLVVGVEGEAALLQLGGHPVEPGEQRVAILRADDPAGGEHPGVGARLGDVLRPQPPVEPDRGVQALEVGVLGLAEARHRRQSMGARGSAHGDLVTGPESRRPAT